MDNLSSSDRRVFVGAEANDPGPPLQPIYVKDLPGVLSKRYGVDISKSRAYEILGLGTVRSEICPLRGCQFTTIAWLDDAYSSVAARPPASPEPKSPTVGVRRRGRPRKAVS